MDGMERNKREKKMIDREKLKAYKIIASEAYDDALQLSAIIELHADRHFKERLTLILFEKILPPMWELYNGVILSKKDGN